MFLQFLWSSDSFINSMGLKYCYEWTYPLTFDCKHSVAKILEVDFAMSIGIEVLGKVFHLRKEGDHENGKHKVTSSEKNITEL